MAQLFYIGVKGLIENEAGQVLLLEADVSTHRIATEPYWDIPGGRIEEGDGLLDTLAREIEEETGVTKLIGKPKHIATIISNHQVPYDGEKLAGLTLVVYRVVIPVDAEIKISEEHTSYEWVDKTEAAKRLSDKYPPEFTTALV